MTANPMASVLSVAAGLDALLAKLNVAAAAGTIEIWSGSMPATPETADSGTKLATCTLSVTAFPASASNGSGGAVANANTITADSNAVGSNSVTAGYFRAKSSAGTVIIQGTVATSSADLVVTTTTILPASVFSIPSWRVTLPGR